jgi:hypothetical protein
MVVVNFGPLDIAPVENSASIEYLTKVLMIK